MAETTNSHPDLHIDQVQKSPKLSCNKLFLKNDIAEALVSYKKEVVAEVEYIFHKVGATTSLI